MTDVIMCLKMESSEESGFWVKNISVTSLISAALIIGQMLLTL